MQNYDSGLGKLAKLKQASIDVYRSRSRERLEKIITTKIKTTMIGAISRIEERMGRLWGQGKPRYQLTERERAWNAVREELRNDILNLGNGQIRAILMEIAQYDVSWNRYNYNFDCSEIEYPGERTS